jgi:hypothetical protein
MSRLRYKSTTRLALIVIACLFLLYIGNLTIAYRRVSSANYPPLKPTQFTVLGFSNALADERNWKIIITYEVPQVVQVLRDENFGGTRNYREDDSASRKRVEMKDVLKVFPVVLNENQIEKIWIEKREAETMRANPNIYIVHINLTEEGKGRLWKYAHEITSGKNRIGEAKRDERLLVVVGEQPWSAPIISSEVSGTWWLLTRILPFETSDLQIKPIFDESIAQEIVNGFESAKKAITQAL